MLTRQLMKASTNQSHICFVTLQAPKFKKIIINEKMLIIIIIKKTHRDLINNVVKNETKKKIYDMKYNSSRQKKPRGKNLNRSYVFAYYFIKLIPPGKPLFWYAEQIKEVKFLFTTDKSRMFEHNTFQTYKYTFSAYCVFFQGL